MKTTVLFDGNWNNAVIEKAINAALISEGVDIDTEIEVIIADKEEIRELNKQNRDFDRVTDVLSFPMFDAEDVLTADQSGSVFLGSMVICSERAIEQAEEYGHSIEREAAFLAVHSVLHLLGYDHELGDAEEAEMFSKQEQILQSIGLTR